MTNDNKYRIGLGLKVIALLLWAFLTIATCAGVWNFCKETTVIIASVALLIVNGYAILRKALAIKPKELEDPHFENPVDLVDRGGKE